MADISGLGYGIQKRGEKYFLYSRYIDKTGEVEVPASAIKITAINEPEAIYMDDETDEEVTIPAHSYETYSLKEVTKDARLATVVQTLKAQEIIK